MEELKLTKIMLCIMGGIMFVLGVLTLAIPELSLTAMALMLGRGFVVTGVFCLISFFSEKEMLLSPGWVLIQGILDIFIGFFLLHNIGTAIIAVPYILAFWMVFGGIAKFSSSFVLRKTAVDKWWMPMLNGLLGIMTSFLIVFFPFFWAGLIIILTGLYLIIYGVLIFIESLTSKSPELKTFA